MKPSPKKYVSRAEALSKLQRYCAYQDRCHQEVRSKLLDLGIYGDDLENIIVELIEEKFLDEERFARSYARGKFRIKRWGRDRIRRELRQRAISPYCIRKAMTEIDEAEYQKVLRQVLDKREKDEKERITYRRKIKLANYLIGQRGFESNLVWEAINERYPK